MGSISIKNKIISFISVTSLCLCVFLSSIGSTSVKAADPSAQNYIRCGLVKNGTSFTYEGIAGQRYSEVLIEAFEDLSVSLDFPFTSDDLELFFESNGYYQYLDRFVDGSPSPVFYPSFSFHTFTDNSSHTYYYLDVLLVKAEQNNLASFEIVNHNNSSFLHASTYANRGSISPIFYIPPDSKDTNFVGNYKYLSFLFAGNRNFPNYNPESVFSSTWNLLISSLTNYSNQQVTNNLSTRSYSDSFDLSTFVNSDSYLFCYASVELNALRSGHIASYRISNYSGTIVYYNCFQFDYMNAVFSTPVYRFNNYGSYPVLYGVSRYYTITGRPGVYYEQTNLYSNDISMITSESVEGFLQPYNAYYHAYSTSAWVTPTPIPTLALTPIPGFDDGSASMDQTEVSGSLVGFANLLDNLFAETPIFALGGYLFAWLYSFSSYFVFFLIVPVIGIIAYVLGRLNQK